MKMARIRYIILSIIIVVMLIGLVPSTYCDNVYGYKDEYWWEDSCVSVGNYHYSYVGNYDYLSKDFDTDVYYGNTEAHDEIAQICYQEFLSWGMTPEGAAAVCGNIEHEGNFDPTVTEGNKGWSSYRFDSNGFGLIGFTSAVWVAPIFDMAYDTGKEWCDLSIQLAVLKDKILPGCSMYQSYLFTEGAGTPRQLSNKWLENIERPRFYNYSQRGNSAEFFYEKFKDLEPQSYTSGKYDSDGKALNSGGTSGGVINKDLIPHIKQVTEWDLVGMPANQGLTSYAIKLSLPKALSSYKDIINVNDIRENIELRDSYDVWEGARTTITFVGMLLVVYSLFILMAFAFDNVNNFIDISLVTLLTFGSIHHVREKEILLNERGYVTTSRMFVIIGTLFAIGLFCISGGLFSYLLKAVYWVFNKLGI